MKMVKALEIILELAEGNALDEDEARDNGIENEWYKQQNALKKFRKLIKYLE